LHPTETDDGPETLGTHAYLMELARRRAE